MPDGSDPTIMTAPAPDGSADDGMELELPSLELPQVDMMPIDALPEVTMPVDVLGLPGNTGIVPPELEIPEVTWGSGGNDYVTGEELDGGFGWPSVEEQLGISDPIAEPIESFAPMDLVDQIPVDTVDDFATEQIDEYANEIQDQAEDAISGIADDMGL
jgi:hypothetical protein